MHRSAGLHVCNELAEDVTLTRVERTTRGFRKRAIPGFEQDDAPGSGESLRLLPDA